KIHRVVVMDHRDCGAYKVILGPEHAKDKAAETASHTKQLRALRDQVKAKHATLEVELLLMALDGSVETIA
ncbi:MAG: carbonic anhydrase, partial [Alphaproteobacteria bacterium]